LTAATAELPRARNPLSEINKQKICLSPFPTKPVTCLSAGNGTTGSYTMRFILISYKKGKNKHDSYHRVDFSSACFVRDGISVNALVLKLHVHILILP
jgi:hypothetical protein